MGRACHRASATTSLTSRSAGTGWVDRGTDYVRQHSANWNVLGAYLYWEGDCADQPVYGCMDPEALNYDPEATVDSWLPVPH